MSKNPKRPKDTNELAKLVVDLSVGAVQEEAIADDKNPAAVELGRMGGLKGGKARAQKLTPEQRQQIAAKAARKRWKNA